MVRFQDSAGTTATLALLSTRSARVPNLRSQASRLALRSSLGVAVVAGVTMLAPEAAWANCGVAGTAVVCDTTVTTDTTYPANQPNDRAYDGASAAPLTLTVDAGSTVSGHGLAISNSGSGGVVVTNDGTIGIDAGNVASAGGTAALAISANGGAINYVGGGNVAHNENIQSGPAFTATQTGGVGSIGIDIGGSVYAGNGDGVVLADVATSTGMTVVTNDVSAPSNGRAGITAQSDSLTGDVRVTANGTIEAGGTGVSAIISPAAGVGDVEVTTNDSLTAHRGIFAQTQGAGAVTVTANGPVSTVNYGVFGISEGGDVTITTGDVTSADTEGVTGVQNEATGSGAVTLVTGNVSAGSRGVEARNTGSGTVSVTTNGTVNAGTQEGILAFGQSDVSVTITDEVRGATTGLTLTGGIGGTGEIAVSGPGGFRGGTGHAADINNLGAGTVRVAVGGASSSLGLSGFFVRDTLIGGDISVTTGAVHTSTVGMNTIDIRTDSSTADVTVTANGDLQSSGTGIRATANTGVSTGNIDITSNGSISARRGVVALNFGTGSVLVNAVGPVSTTDGEGIYAQTNGGNVTVYAGDVTSIGDTGVGGLQTLAGSTATVELTANAVSGTTGFAASTAGTGEVRVYANGTVTGTLLEGIRATGNGALTLFVADRVTGATRGLTLTGGDSGTGNIVVTGTGEFVGLAGDAANILNNGAGTVSVSLAGASSAAGGHGFYVRDTAIGGDIAVVTGAVTALDAGMNAIDVQTVSTSADLTVIADGYVQAGGTGVLAVINPAGAGDIEVTTHGSVTGVEGISALNFGNGTIFVEAFGPVSATTGEGIYAQSSGGYISVYADRVTSATGTAVAGQQILAGPGADIQLQANDVSGTIGFLASNAGTGRVRVTANGLATGTVAEGIRATGNDAVTVLVADQVTGATRGMTLSGGDGGTGNIVVTGTGGFVGLNGDAANIANNGTGTVDFDITGATSSVGGHGIYVRDTAIGGETSVTTGAVTALDVLGNGIDVQLDSTTADIVVVAQGAIQAGNAGVGAGLQANAAGGSVDVTTQASVAGRIGIEAYNLGTGSVTVTAIGPVTSNGGSGISARSNAGNVTVSAADVVSSGATAVVARQVTPGAAGRIDVTVRNVSGTSGIVADNDGASAVSVSASGTVTGASAEGIRATGNEAVSVSVAQTVTGATSGLMLVGGTGGGGDISVTGTGGFVGQNGDGASILNNGTGTVTVDISGAGSAVGGHGLIVRDTAAGGDINVRTGAITALTGSTNAIDVQSQSTAGDVTVATQGDLQAGLAGIVARILPGAADGDIEVTGNGLIAGEFGIDAENAGTGSVSVIANRAITTTDLGILAVSNGGNIIVSTSDVSSAGASAIIAQNTLLAPNVGTIDVSVSAGSTIAANSAGAAGIRTTIGESSGTTTINLDGTINAGAVGISSNSITGAIVTNIGASGVIDPLIGIEQTTVSGAIILNNAGLVEGDNIGVRLTSTGAGAVGALTVNQTGTGRINGVAEQGLLLTSNDAAIAITGNGANTSIASGGIAVLAVNSGTGAISIADNSISGGTGGIAAATTGVNSGIVVTGAGNIGTTTGIGVLLQIDNTASAGDIIVDRSGSIVGEVGLLAQTNGAGDIGITTGGNVTATNGPGIVARNNSAAAGGTIGVTIGAGTSLTAAGGSGVMTESGLSTGATTIDVAGKITATGAGNAGVRGTSSAGAITVNIASTGNIDPDFGIDLATVDGALAVNNAGLVTGTVSAIRLIATGAGTATVNNSGTISSGGNAVAGSLNGGIFSLNNSGTLNGAINVAGSNLATSTMTNTLGATANFGSGSSSFSGSLVNAGAATIGAGGTVAFLRDTTNSGRITFAGAGAFTTSGAMANSGIVDARNNLTTNVVTVGGNYSGGGQFFADYSTGTATADRLNIAGTASGNTNVTMNHVGARSFLAGGFLPVVTVAPGAAANAFTSDSFAPAGFVLESFGQNSANLSQFGVFQAVNPASLSLGSLSFVAETASSLLDEPISPYVTARTGAAAGDKRVSLWMRTATGHTDQVIASSLTGGGVSLDASDEIRVDHDAVQFGADFSILNIGDAGWNVHLGAIGGWYDGDVRLSATEHLSAGASFAGVYLAAGSGAFSVDAMVRKEWRTYDLQLPTVVSAGSQDLDGSATIASFHASYRVGGPSGFAATPFVGARYGSSEIDDLSIDADTVYSSGSDKSRIGQGGVRLSYRTGSEDNWVVEPFASAAMLKNWSRRDEGSFSFGQPATSFALESTTWDDTMRYSAGIMGHAHGGRVSAFVVGNLEDGERDGFTVNGGLRFNF